MYCRNCGNLIDDGDKFCNVCGAKQNETIVQKPETQSVMANPQGQQNDVQPKPCNEQQVDAPVESSYKKGLGMAITSAALGCVASFFSALEFFLAFVAILMTIPTLILGIKSINLFNREKKAGRLKPVATLVLGIVGTVFAGSAILTFFIWFM